MYKTIGLSEPYFNKEEIQNLEESVKSTFVSHGKFIEYFEEKLKKLLNSKYLVTCINGTSALHLALKSINTDYNDEIIVPSITFVAPINAVLYCGASPIFMDCDDYLNLDIKKIIKFINHETYYENGFSWNKKTKKKIKAIIAVHVFGNAVDLYKVISILKKRNIILIEDAAEGIGSYYNYGKLKNKYVGTIGDIGCFSFNANKIITTAGGGAITFKNKNRFLKVKKLINQSKTNSIWFHHDDIGYNYRFNNLNAAIGLAQISKLDHIINKRKELFLLYKKYFNELGKNFEILENPKYSNSNNWLIILKIKKINKNKFVDFVLKTIDEGVNIRPIWKPNHLHNFTNKYQKYEISNCTNLQYKFICLPSSNSLTANKVKYISELFKCLK